MHLIDRRTVNMLACLVIGSTAAHAWVIDVPVSDTIAVHAAQIDSAVTVSSSIETHPHFLQRLRDDFIYQAISPFTMDGTQATYVGAGIGFTAGLIMVDEPIDRKFRYLAADHTFIRKTSAIITDFGGTYGILSSVLFAGYSVAWDDDRAQDTSMLLAEALITSGVWTRVGKLLAGRERPSAAYQYSHMPGGRWHGLYGSLHRQSSETISKYDAFPSGHTATAFAIATVFAKRYNETSTVPIISYTLASVIGLSRMVEHTHWASDVFAGACIGYLCADQAVSRFEKKDGTMAAADPNTTTIQFSVGILNDSPALHCAIGF
jgi:membrane-associated phospholipid phosphatase